MIFLNKFDINNMEMVNYFKKVLLKTIKSGLVDNIIYKMRIYDTLGYEDKYIPSQDDKCINIFNEGLKKLEQTMDNKNMLLVYYYLGYIYGKSYSIKEISNIFKIREKVVSEAIYTSRNFLKNYCKNSIKR